MPSNEQLLHLMAIRHDLATSNWRVDMSEMMMHYPVRLVGLDELIRNGAGKR